LCAEPRAEGYRRQCLSRRRSCSSCRQAAPGFPCSQGNCTAGHAQKSNRGKASANGKGSRALAYQQASDLVLPAASRPSWSPLGSSEFYRACDACSPTSTVIRRPRSARWWKGLQLGRAAWAAPTRRRLRAGDFGTAGIVVIADRSPVTGNTKSVPEAANRTNSARPPP
jgi:hypothetical protein